MKQLLESQIKAQIMGWLWANKFFPVPIQTTGCPNGKGGYRKAPMTGISDILACKDGKFYAIEVKARNNTLSENQAIFLHDVIAVGKGIALTVWSLEDLQEKLKAVERKG